MIHINSAELKMDFVCPRSPTFCYKDYEGQSIGGNESTIALWTRELSKSTRYMRLR